MLDLFEELKALVRRFEGEGIEYALCGGLALAVHAAPRATVDIDLLVPADALGPAKDAARALGFTIPGPSMKLARGALEMHRLSKPDPETGDLLVLDLLLVTPRVRKPWRTRETLQWEDGPVSVVSKAGLIELKSLRGSGQDKEDIRRLRAGRRRRR